MCKQHAYHVLGKVHGRRDKPHPSSCTTPPPLPVSSPHFCTHHLCPPLCTNGACKQGCAIAAPSLPCPLPKVHPPPVVLVSPPFHMFTEWGHMHTLPSASSLAPPLPHCMCAPPPSHVLCWLHAENGGWAHMCPICALACKWGVRTGCANGCAHTHPPSPVAMCPPSPFAMCTGWGVRKWPHVTRQA